MMICSLMQKNIILPISRWQTFYHLTQVAIDFLQLYVQILIEIKFDGISAFRLEGLEVLLVLGNLIRFISKYASRLEVQNLPSKMGSCDKVLHLVITLQSISISQELVSIIHSAERHVTAQFCDSHCVFRLCCHQSLSLQFYSHGGDVLHESLGQLLYIFERLL